MKEARHCPGCGAPFQTEDPAEPGYVPREVLEKGEKGLICRRCFRLANYAEETPVDLRNGQYVEAVRSAVKNADVVWLLVDIIDFAGTWLPEFGELCKGKRVLLVVNKVDLLPARSKYSEVIDWVRKEAVAGQWRPNEILAVSGLSGHGVGQLIGRTHTLAKSAGKGSFKNARGSEGPTPATSVAIVGATNVGKSTLVKRLLKGYKAITGGANVEAGNVPAEGPGTDTAPTVSRFRGTTLGNLKRQIAGARLVVVDTPGIVPRGRLGDQLCPDCASRLVPTRGLNSKLFELEAGQVLMFGGLAAVAVEGVGEGSPAAKAVLLAFASHEVTLHRTTVARWQEIRDQHSGDWLQPPCTSCQSRLSGGGWDLRDFTVMPMQDLAIAGLGWLTVRRAPVRLVVHVPAGTLCVIRPALVGPKLEGPKSS